MPEPTDRMCLIKYFITPIFILVLLLSGCSQKSPPPETPQVDITAYASPQTTLIAAPAQEIPKSSPTNTPVNNKKPGVQVENGVIVLAMKSGRYSQLYAYHPVSLPLTQLTTGEWNHSDPAMSPDGTKLAYCADEFGRWDIFILDINSGEKTRLTETSSFVCSPSWSPDGRWLVHDELLDGKLNLIIRSVVDESIAPVRLTNNGANNFDPAWSPEGREIAFVTDRNGRLEIWLADLDAPEQRFRPVVRSDHADYSSPCWSQTGGSLTWKKTNDFNDIEIWNVGVEDSKPESLGYGSQPVWMDDAEGILAVVHSANGNDLVAYSSDPTRLLIPPIHLQNEITALTWVSGTGAGLLEKLTADKPCTEPHAPWQPEITSQDTSSGRYEMIYLTDVSAPEPYLTDTVNESFASMRAALQNELGWDFLKILDNASISIPANATQGLGEEWGYTGRAIAVNIDPLDSGWMVVNREDILGRTYWRVWLKCMAQDGSCGVPIHNPIWDFNSRVSGDAAAYENGGKHTIIPQGYWIDLTSFARTYGWERLPAGLNWRGYFPDTNINLFVLRNGLTWQEAMREVYSIETINQYWPIP